MRGNTKSPCLSGLCRNRAIRSISTGGPRQAYTINIGYQHIQNEIVTEINGVNVRNMKDVFKAVDKDKGLRSIGLQSLDIDLQLDTEELEEANRRLLKSYLIPAIDSRALKTMQNGKRP